jgi:rhomboid family GlyGly-CTERM serine protease
VNRGARAWAAVALALGAVALAGWFAPRAALDWQPALAAREPWRALSAVGVHYSAAHLGFNLGGVALAGLFGIVARVTPPVAWAWLAAWPLTQLGLLAQPAIEHYGGLSGVLHAGVAAVATFLIVTGTRAQRGVALAVFVGLAAKLWSEAPWGPALRPDAAWGFAVAPFAHASGALAGTLCTLVALVVMPRLRSRHRSPCDRSRDPRPTPDA